MADAAMTEPTRWWLVRHAPVINPTGVIYGQHDIDADVSDDRVFDAVARILPRGAVWLQSPLTRARKTAATLRAVGADGEPPVDEPRLMEQNFGAWQGQERAGILARHPEAYRRFWLTPAEERAPDGESFVDVIDRVGSVLSEWSETADGRDVVAVMHGGSIRAALAIALDLDPARALAFHTETVSVTRIDRYSDGAWGVVFVNVTPWRP
ncbi:MAG: histidine phosphatase family protein [Alphaproteobacteria bacterium]|nr:histidine phosphatase family protein [Alphaproteobacteria bacterium]